MTLDALEIETAADVRGAGDLRSLQWTPIVAGALIACAVSSILVTFAATVGLGVSSTAPTWRDASIALWLLSGIYLVLQALVSFGCGGYLAGRSRLSYDGAPMEVAERRDGLHGLTSWALAVLLGATLAALVSMAASRPTSLAPPATSTEPSELSYEIDHLFRSTRPPNVDLAQLRAQAGRVLMTSSGHRGITPDDRAHLVQLVTEATGITGADAERRADSAIANSKTAISRTRAGTVILAFSIATALLLGAAAAWAGAEAGGRHRDGMPLADWMLHSNRMNRRRGIWQRATSSRRP